MPTNINDNYFYQSKSFRIGSIAVITIILLCFTSLFLYERYTLSQSDMSELSEEQQKLLTSIKQDTSRKKRMYADDYTPYKNYEKYGGSKNKIDYATIQLFDFDPNTIPLETWARLGVREKTAQGIKNYISKGGRFRKPEDIKKIWGIQPQHADRLLPFVKIVTNENATYTSGYASTTYTRPVYTPRNYTAIDINTADTIQWATLPGIGPGYARRIVKFRERLGGFYNAQQVAETFGLPDSSFQKILPYLAENKEAIVKTNINTVTEEVLKLHPYIRWQLAKVIIAYRDQHGPYKKLEELKNIMVITPEIYQKVTPYLSL